MEQEPPSPAALAKKFRPNPDELDDVDDYTPKNDDDQDNQEEQENDALVNTSEKELLQAKRLRRQKAAHMNESESTHIDDKTSLATEGVTIEPFHMEQERNDGSGYFEGDTYVFRKRNPDEEPDAWLEQVQGEEQLDEGNHQAPSFQVMAAATAASVNQQPETQEPAMDSWTKEQLYSQILPLVSDTETVMQAVRRYGFLIQQQKKANGNNHKHKTGNGDDIENNNNKDHYNFAKTSLDDLTGAANALLFKGDVDIYDTTRNDIIMKKLPQEAVKVDDVPPQPQATWEYMGDQDGQLHGPFTTEQMIGWTQAGYFVGAQQVQIRTIREIELSTKDEMLADLMDDDDEDDENEHDKQAKFIKGEWMPSNDVVFTAYLPVP
jgi:CD2 antigen cytoplasmic tail-binding protein 2